VRRSAHEEPAETLEADRAADARTMLITVGLAGGVLAVATSVQAVLVLGAHSVSYRGLDPTPIGDLAVRIGINLITVLTALFMAMRLRIQERRPFAWPWLVALSAAVAAVLRCLLQLATGIYPVEDAAAYLSDAAVAFVMISAVYAVSLAVTEALSNARLAERRRLMHAAQASDALADLQQEELRVRRAIAEQLHGTLQNRFVLLAAELSAISHSVDPVSAARVEAVRAELDELRERELRSLSSSLYPEQLDRGLLPALRALMARVPAAIGVELDLAEPVAELESADRSLDTGRRLVLVRVAEEGLSNALRHGNATQVALTLALEGDRFALTFADDGDGVSPSAGLSGLGRLRDRLTGFGGTLDLTSPPQGGAVLRATLPVDAKRAAAPLPVRPPA
jgi:signal transduction histidine kinase